MGQHISVEHMQGDLDILCLMCTLVYIQYMGFLEAQADIYKLQPSFVAYTLHLRHKERGCRGLWSQVEMLWLKIKKDIILLFQKNIILSFKLTFNSVALIKGISIKSSITNTNWNVITHITISIAST